MDDFKKDNSIIDIPLYEDDVSTNLNEAETINDGLILSLTNLGRVDVDYIANICKKDVKEVINTLKGVIYQNPETWNEKFNKGYETAEEYLSGNLRRKLRIANEANQKYNGYFTDNINAIKKIISSPLTSDDIYVTLGSPWIPTNYIHDFIIYVLYDVGLPNKNSNSNTINLPNYVIHDSITGSWKINNKTSYASYFRKFYNKFATKRIDVLTLIETTLNMKSPIIRDKTYSPITKNHETHVINKNETALAIEAQTRLIETFQNWIWKKQSRKDHLISIYEDLYASNKIRHFDGSFLTFPGLDKSAIELRDYQKNAVARILFTPNTLLAHDVGTGKTFIMIASGMELKRMHLSNKNVYVVPNNIVGQWDLMFKKLYPLSNVFCITPKLFNPQNIHDTLVKMRDNDYDAIIIPYSSFEKIKLSKNFEITRLKNEILNLKRLNLDMGNIKIRINALNKKLEKVISETPDDNDKEIYFEDLHITRLFVDEAHNFKNIQISSNSNGILGVNFNGSVKCDNMLNKVRYIQQENNGGGIVFATGTPITNSITDAYVMQTYLQSGELKLLNLSAFDSWIGMFGERITQFEIDVDTSSYRVATRFAKFHNLPELTSMLASVADFHQLGHIDGLPIFNFYTDEEINKTSELTKYLEEISKRADKVRKNLISRSEDNLLKITTDGRKAALDIRLINPKYPFNEYSKVYVCAFNVAKIFNETKEEKLSQLIFCDSSTPKESFNIYDELKRLLISFGVPSNQIEYIHNANSETAKEKLFKSIRNGEIRILIGSSFKLGLGVNVQDKLYALHHIDVPWRPADMRQREGRILRQGNTNKEIKIFRYITKGSFDAYSWQLLETKQKFIDDLLSGSLSERESTDISDTALSYAEVKALAIGNPLIKKRVETANELNKYILLQKRYDEKRNYNLMVKASMPNRIEKQKQIIEKIEEDIKSYNDFVSEEPKYNLSDKSSKEVYEKERKNIRQIINNGLINNILSKEEKCILVYKCFKVIMPINMLYDKPYLYIEGKYRYRIDMGFSDIGNLARVDNFLHNLNEYLQEQKDKLTKLCDEQFLINKELENKVDYNVHIVELKERLIELDEKIGVIK